MEALHVICLLVFISISSALAWNGNEEIEPVKREFRSYSDNLKTREGRAKLADEKERFDLLNLTNMWDYLLEHKIMGNKDYKNDYYYYDRQGRRNEFRKGINDLIRIMRDAGNENDDNSWQTSFYEYISTVSNNLLDVAKHLLRSYVTHVMDNEEKEKEEYSNIKENICDVTLSMEQNPLPFELIDSLPACPCTYPSKQIYTTIMDQKSNKRYWWKKTTNPKTKQNSNRDIYCAKIDLENNGTKISEYCCYDKNDFLITRGSNVGAIYYMLSEINKRMHKAFDLYHIVKCNFLRLIEILPQNNGNNCEENPKTIRFERYSAKTSITDINGGKEEVTKKR